MNEFEKKVLNYIQKNAMIAPDSTVVVGFSGGADSTALLLVLWELRNLLKVQLKAVHINHCIRHEADKDEAFTRDFCKDRGIEFICVKKDIPSLSKEWNMTEEEAGRRARYEAFEAAAAGGSIAVAHHMDDAAETLLMNLARGTGLHGAGAIRPLRDGVIRPFLCAGRQEIEDYLSDKGQSYCTDATNLENDHTRNRIRNLVMPLLNKEINDEAAMHLARAAEDFARADRFISQQAERLFEKCCTAKADMVSFRTDDLEGEPDIIREYFILKCFEKLVLSRKDIGRNHVRAVLEILETKNGSAEVSLPYGLTARRSYGNVAIGRFAQKGPSETPEIDIFSQFHKNRTQKININLRGLGMAEIEILEYNGKTSYPTASYTKWFDCDMIQTAIFRTRKPEDMLTLDRNGVPYTKKLSKFMTDEKIPEDIRDSMLILADGDSVIWVPGYRVGSSFKVSEKTKNILAINIINGGINNG